MTPLSAFRFQNFVIPALSVLGHRLPHLELEASRDDSVRRVVYRGSGGEEVLNCLRTAGAVMDGRA